MHKARSLANVYYWNKYYKKNNIDLYDIGTYHWLKVNDNTDVSQFAYLCAIIAGYKINNYIKYVCDKSNQLNNSWLNIDTNKNEIKKL